MSTDFGLDNLSDVTSIVGSRTDSNGLHAIGVKEVWRGPGTLAGLPSILQRCGAAPGGRVALLTDETPKAGANGDLLASVLACVADFDISVVAIVAGHSLVHADEATVARAVGAVNATASEVLLSLGSGTVADIGKVVARELDLAHVVVVTAASVNGYTDDQSVLLLRGAKRTTPSRWPDVVVFDTDVLVRAPISMTRSGLGDQLSMYTAAADWYLADAVGFDTSFSIDVVEMMRVGSDDLLRLAGALGVGDPAATQLLAGCLSRGGLAMGMAGRTAPSSGAEHVVSHLLDMRAAARGVDAASHGSQVGVASVLVARVWDHVRARLVDGASLTIPAGDRQRRVVDAFDLLDASGATSAECWSSYARKWEWVTSHVDELVKVVADWSAHDDAVASLLLSGDAVADTLSRAGAPAAVRELDPAPDVETIRWALANGHLLRDRFSVLDLAELAGIWTDDDIDVIIDGARHGS